MTGQIDHTSDAPTRAKAIFKRLRKHYPRVTTALNWSNPLELLVATILSAQCTDQRVNQVTANLFPKYRTTRDYAQADPARFEQEIRTAGFFRQKTKSIIKAAQEILDRFDGCVPDTMEELTSLPGVARKTANVVLGTAFGKNEGIAVDTHVGRVSLRLALSPGAKDSKDAVCIEQDLMKLIPRKDWTFFSHAMILHGRQVCHAAKPQCPICPLLDLCPTGQERASG